MRLATPLAALLLSLSPALAAHGEAAESDPLLTPSARQIRCDQSSKPDVTGLLGFVRLQDPTREKHPTVASTSTAPSRAAITPRNSARTASGRSDDGGGPGGSPPVPEPSTLLLVGGGLVGVALTTRWRRRKVETDT